MKIQYNAPLILTFTLLSVVVFIIDWMTTGSMTQFLGLNLLHSIPALSYVTYVFCHANMEHLFGNLAFILLLGPILEEKYGSLKLALLFAITTVATALIHNLFFQTGLIGASGLVFMLILLISFTGNQQGKIPLTFILVMILFLGKEILASFEADQVSQFGHILGGIFGGIFGFLLSRSQKEAKI